MKKFTAQSFSKSQAAYSSLSMFSILSMKSLSLKIFQKIKIIEMGKNHF